MVDLERRISGDWSEAREAAADPYKLLHYFRLNSERLHDIARSLRMCVEEGILEYKAAMLRPVFGSLEAMQYQTVSYLELERHEQPLTDLLSVLRLQRLLCRGVILPARDKPPEPIGPRNLPANAILANIKQRIQSSPDFLKHPSVKKIFVQVALYQKEKKKMDELLPTIRPDLQPTFRRNFQVVFQRIFDRIRKNFTDILNEEEARRQEQAGKADALYHLSLKNLAPLLNDQAKEVSRLRSTLAFARTDKYKTRPTLVSAYKDKDFYLGLIEKESAAYDALCAELRSQGGPNCPAHLGKRLGSELVRVLEKLARVEAPPQNN